MFGINRSDPMIVAVASRTTQTNMHSSTKILVLLVVACFYPAFLDAVSVSDVKLKILQEQRYIEQVVPSTKSSIADEVSQTRSRLNSRAENIKSDIKAGASSCQRWYEHIEGLQKSMINFMYQFQPCELNSGFDTLRKTKVSLASLVREADKLMALCTIISPSSCSSQTNSMNSAIDLIHSNSENTVSNIKREASACIATRAQNIEKLLDSSTSGWQKCNSSA
ncbi:PREDICTED: uncharacterized protein LOC108559657 [Nicrophorus vespilloides]|uniref:Uncharacterized protein LOC108559657 n=1 Tax=Nicrophorus vespilloides TaxID=110193 RepID=A0ABM1MD45_NICVS|nr:PREDICTED: uncharacterized protein LOC108559657 [Nicrophorus vespilloides]